MSGVEAPDLMNRWNIPAWLEGEITERNRCCVCCGVEFVAPVPTRNHAPSLEHIINDARVGTRDNIARCCNSCNASKGTKNLAAWLQSNYCRARGITASSVAIVAEHFLLVMSAAMYRTPNRTLDRAFNRAGRYAASCSPASAPLAG